MNIAIDAKPLLDKPNSVSVYTSYLVMYLLTIRPDVNVYALAFSDDIDKPKLITHQRLNFQYLEAKRDSYEKKAQRFGRLDDVSQEIKVSIDAALYTNSITWPWLSSARKTFLFIHDLAYSEYPKSLDKNQIKLLNKLVPKSVKNTQFIVTLSPHLEAKVKQIFGTSKPVIQIPPGFNNQIFNNNILQGDPATLLKYSLPQDYVLHLGNIERRKNISGVIKAYSQIDDDLKQKHPLVLAGKKISDEAKETIEQARQSGLEIHTPGTIAQEDMGALYRMARAFISLSFYEGFGMPVLEAMACGTPVVCSSIPSYLDIAGESAMQVQPNDTKQAGRALSRILKDNDIRSELIEGGLQRAQRYSWQTSAETLLSFLN